VGSGDGSRWILSWRLWGTVRGRGRAGVFGVWGLCVSGRGKRKSAPQPSSGSLRTAFPPNVNRARPDLGAETPVFGFRLSPLLPPIPPLFATSPTPSSPYPKIRPVPPSKTQALMQNRPSGWRESPRNRVSGVSAPRSGETRCGHRGKSVQGGGEGAFLQKCKRGQKVGWSNRDRVVPGSRLG